MGRRNALAKEIKQAKPFSSVAEEAGLNIMKTAAFLEQSVERALKPHGISATQYNALRILRGAGPAGLSCQEAASRMIRPEPDLTRLFDRIEARGLMLRERSEEDRRIVLVRITAQGKSLLASVDGVMETLAQQLLGPLGKRKLQRIIDACEEVRNPD
ncbi:MAG TPA: MarR family transcriptional regulator [Planctomycetota bacterium]|nr:MarR family transcriptional regulator [Planctomycetota bacterium]